MTLLIWKAWKVLQQLRSCPAPPPLSSSAALVPAKKKVISIEEYNCRQAAEWQLASAYLDREENGDDLDYEDFEPQDDPANIQISYQTPMPVPQIADLPLLQDATSLASQLATTMVAPNVTIPMPQGNTGPGTIPGTTVHHVATAANWAPGFGRGLLVARASPMQVGTPPVSASPMQVTTPAALPHRTPGHALTAEEELLQGATLPCSPQWEANLLNSLAVLMDNHIKMMDAFITWTLMACSSSVSRRRPCVGSKRQPKLHQATACCRRLDIPHGSSNNPVLSQEFYRAVSNLGTAIVELQQFPPQQRLAGNCHPDPEIESTVANMYRHEQASGMLSMDSNNNPRWGRGLSRLLSSHYTWTSPSGIKKTEDRKPKAQDYCSLATSFLPYALVTFPYYLGFLYLFTTCVLFRKNHVNVFALCSRP